MKGPYLGTSRGESRRAIGKSTEGQNGSQAWKKHKDRGGGEEGGIRDKGGLSVLDKIRSPERLGCESRQLRGKRGSVRSMQKAAFVFWLKESGVYMC